MFLLALVAVVLWVLCGIPAALIAHRKGRNAVLWAILGCTFGILGLITVASLPQFTQGGPWDAGSGDSLYFGGYGSSGDFSGSNDFSFGDFGGGSDGGGGCGGGGCGGGGCGGG